MKPLKDFQIKRETKGSVTVLRLTGQLDDYTVQHLQGELTALHRGGRHRVVINCSDVDSISTAAIRSLADFARTAREAKGDMILINLPEKSRSIFEVLGFSKELRVHADEKAAIKELTPPEEPSEGEKK